ncbi:anhydro-N-acetylmuramic acid kinase [Thalassotalea marina]|uniref:Anhydro-N-acetylmuramic acid kinase n=1 Tax=Thalassotalea marina TaxID=1673741 RepID=A0A919EGZ4_9GAMM|nr:anhydro-N-acetylmuramic acid kinase [Thalassotalea marina]GHF77143.1 anhydro-N-acetylmuramic acid kinase [Thalassotalea marina]
MTQQYYIGIMSGTSADGADIALVKFNQSTEPSQACELIAHHFHPYPDNLHHAVTSLYQPDDNEIDRAWDLNVELAHFYHQAVQALLNAENIQPSEVIAIGNHGQTIRHRPEPFDTIKNSFTLQIGCNQTLACLSQIRVIGDFRTKDMVLGGQGAPLVPAFHHFLFEQAQQDTFIVNLGGIANVTYLPADKAQPVVGFDTGPANALLDAWCYMHTGNRYDKDGEWATTGQIIPALLDQMLADSYFSLPFPKSTGREYFNIDWLNQFQVTEYSAHDIQATLVALTATSVANAVAQLSPKGFVYLCGGGINNTPCYKLINHNLSNHSVNTIHSLNLNNQAFEAMAFAWLAYAYDKKIYNHIPEVTGASRKTILGIEFLP